MDIKNTDTINLTSGVKNESIIVKNFEKTTNDDVEDINFVDESILILNSTFKVLIATCARNLIIVTDSAMIGHIGTD